MPERFPETVLVTGAAGALGDAVVRRFASAGARVALLDIEKETIERRAAALGAAASGAGHLAVAADLADEAAVKAAVGRVLAAFGRIDALANLAGGFAMGPPVHETPLALWRRMMDLNATGLVIAAGAVVPAMLGRGRGAIVNVGALSALSGKAAMAAYTASKAAVIRLTESMAAELRDKGINVNCVLPSIIDTPANRAAMPKADFAKWVAPAALADVIAFLASDGARAIHGAAIPVAGLS
jgi:NAD(P)-dependent dehydrogenase (short-subunit alcohol dehydrogenase family)